MFQVCLDTSDRGKDSDHGAFSVCVQVYGTCGVF